MELLEKLRRRWLPGRRPRPRAFAMPDLVLEIQPGFVAGARLSRSGRSPRHFERMWAVETQPAPLEAALNRVNVLTAEPLHQAVRDVVQAVGNGSRRVGLLIPDAACRVVMLSFEALPDDRAEAEALIRWRMKDTLPFPPEEATVSHQLIRRSENTVELLTVGAKASVLAEYESALDSMDCGPVLVLPATVALLPLLPVTEGAQLLVHVCSSWVTAAVVAGGGVRLWRTRRLDAAKRNGSGDFTGEIAAEVARILAGSGDALRAEVSHLWLCARPPAGPELGPELAARLSREVRLVAPEKNLGADLPKSERPLFDKLGAVAAGLLANAG